MIFFVANDGTVISSVPSPVYQGSVNVNNVYLIAPFAENLQVTVAFKLPNGVYTERYAMTRINKLTGIVNEKTGKSYNGWQFSLPNEITCYFGTVTAQFFFYSAVGGAIVASSYVSFVVEQGVPQVLPSTPDEDVYDAILSNLSLLSEQLNNGAFAARAIYQWNSAYVYGAGEITYYADFGEYGAFVKSLEANNNSEPFVSGVFNRDKWQLISDFNILTELYGLRTEVENALAQSQANAAAANESAAEAANAMADAQSSAQSAQEVAESIKDSTDYLYGIKNGTLAVNKAEMDGEGNNIASQFSIVQADISGLREDISNEAHFRGMFESVEALRAAYPTATPNDYAYIVGGNIYIWQNNAWTNSGQPSPNTAVPASNATPLMNGVASAGASSQYSRGDHRHPTDTSKVNKSGDTMSGNLIIQKNYPTLTFANDRNARAYFEQNDENQFYLAQTENNNIVGVSRFPKNNGTLAIEETVVKKSGDTMTGNLKVPALISADKPNSKNTPLYILPYVSYEEIAPSHDTGDYLKALLKWICRNYPNVEGGLWLGRANPNSAGQIIIDIYDTSEVDGDGMPKYCCGTYRNLSGEIVTFNTNAYEFTGFYSATLSSVYPVGSIYISVDSTSPAQLFGGSWTAISNGYYLKAVTSDAGQYGSEGLPNIRGSYEGVRTGNGGQPNAEGALYMVADTVSTLRGGEGSENRKQTLGFDASRSNSIYGRSLNVTPLNYSVYMWRKTAL